jgi:uncharacterized protein (TIGR02246 family)
MKAIRWGSVAVAACVFAVGCKTVSVAPGAEQVKLTSNAADVAGCTSLGSIDAMSSMLTDPDAERQLVNQTFTLGGNVLLFGSSLRRSGTAYACGEAANSSARAAVSAAAPAPAAAASAPAAPAKAAPVPPAAPAQIVQRQLEAYKRRDLEGFLSFYADDARIVDYPDQVLASGKDAMREFYRKLFEPAPQLDASIQHRIAMDRFVIDQERITGLAEGKTIEGVAIYEVKDGRIVRLTFLRR